MKWRLHALDNCFAGKKCLPTTKLATESVLSKNCMLFTTRVSPQQSYLKNSWERRYMERQNSRHGPPKNRTKIQVRAESAKGE